MSWEINERRTQWGGNGYTIWQGRDAEGRRCYATTADRGGVAVEPTGANIHYSKAAAIQAREEV